MVRRRVLGVLQVIRHTRTTGMGTSLAGSALSMRRGEETARFFTTNPNVAPEVKRRGLAYSALHSPQQRTTETEQQFYQGFVSLPQIAKLKRGGWARKLGSIADVAKTPAGEEQYARHVPGLLPSAAKLHRGEPQPHYAESIESVRDRVGIVKKIDAVFRRKRSSRGNSPVMFVNLVSHSLAPYGGPIELMFEHLTGKKPENYGGVFNHTEGFRRIYYDNGTVETHILRQNQEKNRVFKTRRSSERRR